MQAQLEQPGMPRFSFIAGVDGRAISASEAAKLCDAERAEREFGRALTPGELGCALGHQAAYRAMVERGLSVALVFEDDAVLGHQFLKLLERVLPMIDPARPQVVLLSHVGRYSAWGGRPVDKDHCLYRPYTAWGAHAYLATSEAAKALIAAQQPIYMSADHWVHFHKNGVVDLWGLVPYCVGTAPLAARSTVGDDRLGLRRRHGWRRWVHKYLWLKLVFQLVVKPVLRLWKQPSTW